MLAVDRGLRAWGINKDQFSVGSLDVTESALLLMSRQATEDVLLSTLSFVQSLQKHLEGC